LLQERLQQHVLACAAPGRELPGPLPAHEHEPDPATAITDGRLRPSATEEHDD
jgi:hypothetical protein